MRRMPARGEAEVWLALGPLGAPAMLKRAPPAARAHVRALLRHESDLLQMLEVAGMPATPRVLDADFEGAAPWLALSWREGPDLVTWSRSAATPVARRARIAERLVRLYAELHERGVLHGDPHPCNVRVDDADRVWLVDFTGGRLAEAPSDPAGERVESYAVAAMAYRIAMGDAWMDAPHPASAPAAPPARLAWPALERVLARALAADPAGRWPNLGAFAEALARAIGEAPHS